MKKMIFCFGLLAILGVSCDEPEVRKKNEAQITTLAGGAQGDQDGPGTQARLWFPGQITSDKNGVLYFTDLYNHKVKRITAGNVITIAGSTKGFADGPGTAAKFNYPYGIAVGSDGTLFVSDSSRIRKITADGVVSTIAGNATAGNTNGTGTAAAFNSPAGLAIGPDNSLYIADMYNSVIRKISPDGVVTTLAGNPDEEGYQDGTGLQAKFNHPAGIEMSEDGALFVADTWNHRIRKVTTEGVVTTVAGDGSLFEGNSAQSILIYPMDITLDHAGSMMIADGRGKIIIISASGSVSYLAGANESGYVDGAADVARFGYIMGLVFNEDGAIYTCDSWNHAIRKISFE